MMTCIEAAGFFRSDDFYLQKLHHFRQTSTVQVYQIQFEMLQSLVRARHSHINEAYFLSCCIHGLKDEIRRAVQLFWPSSVDQVFSIAKLQ